MFGFLKRIFTRPDIQAIGRAVGKAAVEEAVLTHVSPEGRAGIDRAERVLDQGKLSAESDEFLAAFAARISAEIAARRV